MIKFFRKIRQSLLAEGKLTQYLIYAIGEIILVVIGILIALQINNWNEDRKAQNVQKGLLISLYENLGSDSIELAENRLRMLNIIETQNQLHALRHGQLEPLDIDSPQNIRGSFRNYSITQANHPDIATKVFSETLKVQIRAYFRNLSDLDNAYAQYDNVVKEVIRPYLAENLALNSDFLFDNQGRWDDSQMLRREPFYRVVKEEYFSQILFEANLKALETVKMMDEILSENSALRHSIKNEIDVQDELGKKSTRR